MRKRKDRWWDMTRSEEQVDEETGGTGADGDSTTAVHRTVLVLHSFASSGVFVRIVFIRVTRWSLPIPVPHFPGEVFSFFLSFD